MTKVVYKGGNVTENLTLNNITFGKSEHSFLPTLLHKDFDTTLNKSPVSVSFYRRNKKDFVSMKGPEFFQDTFQIECVGDECCQLLLKNDDKLIEMIFNGIMLVPDSRKCPSAADVLDRMNW